MLMSKKLTPRNRDLPETLLNTQLFMKFPPFMEPEVSLPCSQEPVNGPYSEPEFSSSQLPTLCPQDSF